jgi:hypothetical protein
VIKAGEKHRTKYYGHFTVKKVAELPEPLVYETKQWGKTVFRPVLAQIEWQDGKKEFWLPYWIGPVNKERYGQYAPMMGERELLLLLLEAIKQKFFSKKFLSKLSAQINNMQAN